LLGGAVRRLEERTPEPTWKKVAVGDHSAIEWTEATWNPTTGCDKTSPGCDNCYALTLAKRLKAMGQAKYQRDGNPTTSGPGFGLTLHPDTLDVPRSWATPRTIFVDSMSDLFHSAVPEEYIRLVFQVIAETPQHQYQVLTKRSKRLANVGQRLEWPPNLWMGVSVENSKYRFRIDHLRRVGAAVRFISAEPLLGPLHDLDLNSIHWVIAGGESGPRARPMDPAWVFDLRDQCNAARVPFFFKQWGGRTPKARGRELDGNTHDAMPDPAVA
jgi:protein gp37